MSRFPVVPPFLRCAREIAADPAALAFLTRNRLLPVWARRIEETGEPLPEELAETVRSLRRQNGTKGLLLVERARPLLEAAIEAGIPVVVYKGAVVSETLFRSSGDRAMTDIDVWCPERAEEALRIALSLGWHVDPGYAVGETGSFGWGREINLFSPRREIAFDLHRELFPPRRFSAIRAPAVRRLRPAPPNFPGGVLALDPRDETHVGVIHAGGHHGWESLLRHWEVGRALRLGGAELLAELRGEADEAGCRRMLELSIALCRTHLGFDLPEQELDARGRFWLGLVERAFLRELAGRPPAGRTAQLVTVLLQQDRMTSNFTYGIGRILRT